MKFQLNFSNPKWWCCESAALNIPANLENSAVATRLEKVNFHSNTKERQCQRMSNYHTVALISHTSKFSSVAQSCPTLCDPTNHSMPGLPVHHQLPESTQTSVHWVSDAIQPSHPLSSPTPPALNLSQHQGLFKWVSSSHQVAKVLEFQLQHQSFPMLGNMKAKGEGGGRGWDG